MDDELWAHSVNGRGVRHLLADHLRGTAALARTFGDAFGAGDLAGFLGLTHDVGKSECGWQQGLLAVDGTHGSVGIDHKYAGTWLAQRAVGPFAMCIDGHHGGLQTLDGLKGRLRKAAPELISEWEATAARAASVVPEITTGSASLVPAWAAGSWEKDPLAVEMLARLVFSCLVDADFLDTEAHFSGASRPVSHAPIGGLAGRYETRRAELLAKREPSPADQSRADRHRALEIVGERGGDHGLDEAARPG